MLLASAMDVATGAPLFSVHSLVALLALTAMEIVLGIDNIVFIAIITGRLPEDRRSFARRMGLFLAMIMRVGLLLMIGWLMGLEAALVELSSWAPLESLAEWLAEDEEINAITGRDLILFGGGMFLLYTAVRELHHKVEGESAAAGHHGEPPGANVTVSGVLIRIALMDAIFSLDSVITAVGMADHIEIMVVAVIIAVGVMIAFANQISEFVQAHPTVKILALSFLILIAVVLISDAAGTPLSKGYVYFAMAFSLLVEFLNLRMKMKRMRPSEGEGETGSVRAGEAS